MVVYSLTKVESSVAMAVAVSDYLFMTSHPITQVIGYGILAGLSGYFGKHFITNAMNNEKSLLASTPKE
jgi:hypothetical protein